MDVSRKSRVVRQYLNAAAAVALSVALVAWQGEPRSPVSVYGVGVPRAPTARWGTRSSVDLRVSVRNDSTDPAPYLIRVELEGVATSSATPVSTIAAGAIVNVPVRVDVDLRAIASGGDKLPFTVVLLDARRQARHRFTGALPVTPVRPSLTLDADAALRPMTYARDIAITRIEYVAASERLEHPGGMVVTLRNRGRERWAYTGSVEGQIGLGTPETHIEPSTYLTLQGARVPPGLAPGDSAVLLLRQTPIAIRTPIAGTVVPPLPTELWITVRAYLTSSYDVNPSNDALYLVLRLGADRRVVESRILPAPPPTVRVIPR